MPALLLIIKNAIGAIALYYLKKNAPELVVDFTVSGLEKLADLTETELDNDAVSKFKSDRVHYIDIIRKVL